MLSLTDVYGAFSHGILLTKNSSFATMIKPFQAIYADVAELADAPDLGSGVYDVQVQLLSSAPNEEKQMKRTLSRVHKP